MARREDKELREYRDLMKPPEKFDDGFSWKTVVAALFLGFIMMPGSMYLALVVGTDTSMNSAARWVTIILFAEVARRSLKELKMQEIYILYYMAGLAVAQPFESLLWRQYMVRSEFSQALGVAQDIPFWYAPSAEELKEAGRTFFTKAWIAPIALSMVAFAMTKLESYGLGYFLYRLSSDVEELPFPMAPVAASGILALANTQDQREKWRWRCFSIGGMIGLVFGLVYIAVPVISGAILPKPVTLIPIPWVDYTPALGNMLPAVPLNITFDLTFVFVGMVIPFWAVIGGFLGVVFTMIFNPVLYDHGILTNWKPGMGFVDTMYINNVDFYLSFGVGLTLAIAGISLAQVFKPLYEAVRKPKEGEKAGIGLKAKIKEGWRKLVTDNKERGDFSIYLSLAIYVVTSATWIVLACWLIEGFPWEFFVFYAVVYTPLISYATAKLEGLCGQAVRIPLVREATFILSGYQGVDIWFAPVPFHNFGIETVNFRVLELTGTKIMSQVKTLLVTLPIVLIASVIFAEMLWRMADVPSDAYPYAQKMWELHLKNMLLTFSATMEGGSIFMEAWDWGYFGIGFGMGTGAYAILMLLGMPTLLIFGLVRGLGQSSPGYVLFELLGALIGRFYFRRKFGDMWMKYSPVLLAGFSCGMGLVAMVAMSFTILSKMMKPLVF